MSDDLTLVRAALAGEAVAAQRLVRRIADRVWAVCGLLAGAEDDARAAFGDVLAALQDNSFARLASYDGRGRLDVFVTLAVRDLLCERLLRLLHDDRHRGWAAFERFFETDLRRIIQRRLPGADHDEARRDAYQDICAAFVEDDFRRLRAYNGTGSFAGFVLRMSDRLMIDQLRQLNSRRRLPAAVERMTPLAQEVFKLVWWRKFPPDPPLLENALRALLDPPPVATTIADALKALGAALPAGPGPGEGTRPRTVSLSALPGEMVDGLIDTESATPEDALAERQDEAVLANALSALRRAAEALPPDERLYLTVALGGTEPRPAREIARLIQRPVEEVYKLKQRALKRLKDAIGDDLAVKNWRASV